MSDFTPLVDAKLVQGTPPAKAATTTRARDPLEQLERTNEALLERSHQRLSCLREEDLEIRDLAPPAELLTQIRKCATTIETVAKAFELYADRTCLAERAFESTADGTIRFLPALRKLRYRDVWKRVEAFASGLEHEKLVRPGDFVGICGFPSIDWVVADYAALHRAAVSAPIGTYLSRADLEGVIRECEIVCLVCSADQLDAIDAVLPQCPSVKSLVVINVREGDRRAEARVARRKSAAGTDGLRVITMKEVEAIGQQKGIAPKVLPSERGEADPLMTLIFTSGSTGTPKGAMFPESLYRRLWQAGPVSMGRAAIPELPAITVCYQPLSHSAGRWVVLTGIVQGGLTSFVAKSDMSTLFEDIRLLRPTDLVFVPRVASLIQQSYQDEVIRRSAGVSDREGRQKLGDQVMAEMRRSFLGDRILLMSIGAAPVPPDLVSFLQRCFEVPVIEPYGATEVLVVAADHRIYKDRGVEWKLVDVPDLGYRTTDRPYPRGELYVKTRFSVPGYYKNERATNEHFDDEGFWHSGDIAEQRGPDRLHWIDRGKNILKLSQGEFVATARLEAIYASRSPFIHQIYLYGNGLHSYLLAVIVPDLAAASAARGLSFGAPAPNRSLDDLVLKDLLRTDIARIAREERLPGHEVPRDFLIERTPFSVERGLLTISQKQSRPALQARYGKELDALYTKIESAALEEVYNLHREGERASPSAKVKKAIGVTLGLTDVDVERAEHSFIQLGGDSLSAVRLATLIEDLTGVSVPVGFLLDPTSSVRSVVEFVEHALAGESRRNTTFAELHGAGAKSVRAEDVRIEKFLGPEEIAAAREAAPASELPERAQVALLTGANGFLGRFLVLELLERLSSDRKKLFAIVRARDDAAARERLRSVYRTDHALAKSYGELSAGGRLVVLAGDLMKPRFGLGSDVYARLETEVDLVVHPGALVNHALNYEQVFEPNVLGTVEVLRFALGKRRKAVSYVSTYGVVGGVEGTEGLREDVDLRTIVPVLPTETGYAPGYRASKWASELLLRDAGEKLGLPVLIFRPSEIMAHSRYQGQVNVIDIDTRLLAGIVYTGLAPESFYVTGNPTRHFDGLPVEVMARSIAAPSVDRLAIGDEGVPWAYHVTNPHYRDEISLDVVVDWVKTKGYPVKRIPDYDVWYRTFEDRLKALGEPMRQHSPLVLLHAFEHPIAVVPEVDDSRLLTHLRAISPGLAELPHVSEALIHRMLGDMVELGLIEAPR